MFAMRTVRGKGSLSAFAVLAMLAGCGGSNDGDVLAGTTWSAAVSPTDTLVAEFHADGTYTEGTYFRLTSGATGVDVEKGVYVIQGNQLAIVPKSVSCPDRARVNVTAPFAVVGVTLTIDFTTNPLMLQEVNDSTLSGAGLVYGCNAGDTFTPHDIVSL